MTRAALNSVWVGMTASYRKVRTDRQFPETVGTPYAQRGVLDGSSHCPSEATENEEMDLISLAVFTSTPSQGRKKKRKKLKPTYTLRT